MNEEFEYIAYELKEEPNEKSFLSSREASEYFGVTQRTIQSVSGWSHRIKGTQPNFWMIFKADMKVEQIESELERRL